MFLFASLIDAALVHVSESSVRSSPGPTIQRSSDEVMMFDSYQNPKFSKLIFDFGKFQLVSVPSSPRSRDSGFPTFIIRKLIPSRNLQGLDSSFLCRNKSARSRVLLFKSQPNSSRYLHLSSPSAGFESFFSTDNESQPTSILRSRLQLLSPLSRLIKYRYLHWSRHNSLPFSTHQHSSRNHCLDSHRIRLAISSRNRGFYLQLSFDIICWLSSFTIFILHGLEYESISFTVSIPFDQQHLESQPSFRVATVKTCNSSTPVSSHSLTRNHGSESNRFDSQPLISSSCRNLSLSFHHHLCNYLLPVSDKLFRSLTSDRTSFTTFVRRHHSPFFVHLRLRSYSNHRSLTTVHLHRLARL
ncbi:uncharacterized protein LOC118488890 [Helianthus annuus]|uniref:uncharacterized protein LOC118488890 n=1 Tax=Helianthus annuus TaxID=4232 RepID=UPI001652FC78|nr:uncharacterized protein LOC118488890 [Helianthus annuus]